MPGCFFAAIRRWFNGSSPRNLLRSGSGVQRNRERILRGQAESLEPRLLLAATPSRITSVTGPEGGIRGPGADLTVSLAWNSPVTVQGLPQVPLMMAGQTRWATYTAGSGTSQLQFRYTVAAGDQDRNGVTIGSLVRLPREASLRTLGNQPAARVIPPSQPGNARIDGVAPKVTTVRGPKGGVHRAGDDLSFTIVFSEPVIVTGVPYLPIELGGGIRNAFWDRQGSGGSRLNFVLPVERGDQDLDGVRIAGSIGLRGDTAIRDASGNSALVSLSAFAAPFRAARVDASPQAASGEVDSASWMSALPDRTRLFDLYLPGTHDTGTYAYGRFGSPDINMVSNRWAITQDLHADVPTQLRNGIRFLDLRVRWNGEELELYHTVDLRVSLNAVLDEVQQFLRDHPSEAVLVSIQPDAGEDITPANLQRIVNQHQYNRNLPLYDSVPQNTRQSQWVAGHLDFEDIRRLRDIRGLTKLDSSFNLVDTATYDPSEAIMSPRTPGNPRLNYHGLALGDVRGKIILLEKNFAKYPDGGWNTDSQNLDPLDNQIYSTGWESQDNYEGPGYQEKKNDIADFAVRTDMGKKLPLNYTSASGGPYVLGNTPVSFALTINSGKKEDQYRSPNESGGAPLTDTVASLLSPSGQLQRYNVSEKLLGRTGLSGVMLGDFQTTSYAWYNEFWNGFWYSRRGVVPSPNSDDYPPSDWLTSRIWKQSGLVTPRFVGAVNDPATGLPTFREGQADSGLRWNSFLGLQPELAFKITQVSPAEIGVNSPTSSQPAPQATTLRGLTGLGVDRFSDVGASIVSRQFAGLNAPLSTGPFAAKNGQIDGARFFKVELVNPSHSETPVTIGAVSYFRVID